MNFGGAQKKFDEKGSGNDIDTVLVFKLINKRYNF